MKIKHNAQSMVELAVFGSVLLFLIGAIATSYLSGAFQQNAQLYAMRKALLSSWDASVKKENTRVSASFVMFEDRLTGDFGKFGSMDRQPVVASGSGMLTVQAMGVADWPDPMGLPMTDMVVNGIPFVFRTAAWVRYYIFMKKPPFWAMNNAQVDENAVQIIQIRAAHPGETFPVSEDQSILDAVNGCLANSVATGLAVNCNAGMPEQRKRLFREWSHARFGNDTDKLPYFFVAITANSTKPQFNALIGSTGELSAWDWNRNGNYEDDLPDSTGGTLSEYRQASAWRWAATTPQEAVGQINYDSGSFPPYDVNGDLSEESLHSVGNLDSLCTGSNCWCTSADPDCHNSAYSVTVLDSTAGDVNPSKSYRDFPGEPLKAPGLRADLRIYGRTTCVATTGPNATTCQNEDEYTYLDVKEGRAYSKNGKAISISEAKKNQYDVIERIYQLNSNITDIEGFKQNNNKSIETECDDPLAVPQPMDPLLSCCMTGGRVETTCLDKTTKTLFIRSRISDKRGHRWTTDTSKTWNQSLGGK